MLGSTSLDLGPGTGEREKRNLLVAAFPFLRGQAFPDRAAVTAPLLSLAGSLTVTPSAHSAADLRAENGFAEPALSL